MKATVWVVFKQGVYRHECGAKGPHADAMIFERAELWGLQTHAVRLWNTRDGRHRVSNENGLDIYPCADGRHAP